MNDYKFLFVISFLSAILATLLGMAKYDVLSLGYWGLHAFLSVMALFWYVESTKKR